MKDSYIKLSDEEIKLGFVASCVEYMATKLKVPYREIFERLDKADMIDNFIYRHYEGLHTESRENLTDELIKILEKRESGND